MVVPDRDVQLKNVIDVCSDVRGMLGPFGTNKLVIDRTGEVTLTSAPSVFLETLDATGPSLTLMRTAATGFRERNGDGAGSVVVLAGALLSEARDLVEQGVHPTSIERGYGEALRIATRTVDDCARPCNPGGREREQDQVGVAKTALTGTRDPYIRARVSEFVTEALAEVERRHGDPDVDVVARLGAARSETELIRGTVLDADPVHEEMPREIEGGIAVLSDDVDIDAVGTVTGRRENLSVRMETDSFRDRADLAEAERGAFDETFRAAVEAGCRCIITSGSINDRVKTRIATGGVLSIHQIEEAERARICRATGAEPVPTLSDVTADVLGNGTVSIVRKAGRDMTVVRGDGDVYTLFCRAPDPRSVAAFERSVESAVAAVSAAVTGGIVAGGGAVETAAARAVRAAAYSRDGREQLAMRAFADALEVIPRALAENAGLDATGTLAELRAAHRTNDRTAGIDVTIGEVVDADGADAILEPAPLKRDFIAGATDLAVRLIRIDEVVAANDLTDDGDDGGSEGD